MSFPSCTVSDLNNALKIQKESGNLLGEVLIAEGMIRAIDFYRILADEINLDFCSDDFSSQSNIVIYPFWWTAQNSNLESPGS